MRPSPAPPRPYAFPQATRIKTVSGIDIVVATTHRLPLATIQIVVNGGAMRESAAQAGLALLTARGLVEGTADLSADDVAERFELLGSSITPSGDWESIQLHCTVLSTHVPAAFSLIGQLLREPAFRESDIQRLRDERLAELLQRDTDARELADDEFARSVYTSGDRLSLPLGGERDSVERLSRDASSMWHQAVMKPANISIVVVGNVEASDIESVVNHEFGVWEPSMSAVPPASANHVRAEPRAVLVEVEGAAQTELRIGHAGPPRRHPDYYALTVMNAILGGLFGSRINLNLREAHGYTYGASSGYSWRRDGSLFVVSTAVGSDATVPALEEVDRELKRIREQLVTPTELSLALDHLEGVFPLRFETTEALANALAVQGIYELPERYFDEYRSQIRAVTANDVQRVAEQHLTPDHLHTIVVGSPTVREAVEAHFGSRLTVKRLSTAAGVA
ncbi:MAG: pitrilysin family protein [Gemmatimonadaceae bacterium]